MVDKSVFADQVEQFAVVVHALLQEKETRTAFARAPIATLEQHGITFKDAAVAKRVEVELARFAGAISEDDICPPWTWAISPMSVTRTATVSYVRTGSIARATSMTWAVVPEDIGDVIKVDQPRVDAFVTQVSLQGRIAMQDAKIAAQEARIAELEARLRNR